MVEKPADLANKLFLLKLILGTIFLVCLANILVYKPTLHKEIDRLIQVKEDWQKELKFYKEARITGEAIFFNS